MTTIAGVWSTTEDAVQQPALLDVWLPLIAADPELIMIDLHYVGDPVNIVPAPNAGLWQIDSLSFELLDAITGDDRFFIVPEDQP